MTATGFFLRLFTSSLLSQDLVNIEGIVPLKRICESAKHSYIINPPAENRSLMNLTSLEIKNRSLESCFLEFELKRF